MYEKLMLTVVRKVTKYTIIMIIHTFSASANEKLLLNY